MACLVDSVLASYQQATPGNGYCPDFIPNRDIIIEIIGILRQILFPGYFEKKSIAEAHREYFVGSLLVEVQKMLEQQIWRALNYDKPERDDELKIRANELSFVFLNKIPEIRAILLTDVQATLEGDPAARDPHEIVFAYPGIFAICVYRIAHELHSLSIPLIPRIMTEHAHGITGIDIHPGAQIGHHFFIDHGTGVVIGETTVIGNHVKIYQGVTLGALSTRGGQSLRGIKRHPTLEDEVTVYSAASIFGGETIIGQGAVIGSNSFITGSVAANTKASIKTPERGYNAAKEGSLAE